MREYEKKGFLIEFRSNLIAVEFITNYAGYLTLPLSLSPSLSVSFSLPLAKLAASACLIQFPLAIYCSIICSVSRFFALSLSASLYLLHRLSLASLGTVFSLASGPFPLHVFVQIESVFDAIDKC